jgi:hypothetical protein
LLVLDRNKIQYLGANTAAPFAMLRAYTSAKRGMDGYPYSADGDYSALGGYSSVGDDPQFQGYGLGLNISDIEAANQFNPEPISHAALTVIASIQQFFGIGQGRMEADKIVPIQNYIHYNVLAPIAEAVNATYKDALSRSQLNSMLEALLTTKENWLNFLHNTQWSDGRAAVQAEDTLAFLFDDQERKIRELLPNAPYFSNVEPPVYTPYTPSTPIGGRGGPVITSGISPAVRQTASYLPWILGIAAVMMLPKIGKYERR